MIALLFADGVLNWLQNIIAFSILSLVTPLTYAVASASKRIFVIGVSLLVLGNPVTWTNIFGMTLAIFGVLCYNQVSYTVYWFIYQSITYSVYTSYAFKTIKNWVTKALIAFLSLSLSRIVFHCRPNIWRSINKPRCHRSFQIGKKVMPYHINHLRQRLMVLRHV